MRVFKINESQVQNIINILGEFPKKTEHFINGIIRVLQEVEEIIEKKPEEQEKNTN